MAACRNGQHVIDTEIPGREVVLERRDESAGSRIDVDANLVALFGIDPIKDVAHRLDRIVVATVVIAHNADHAHGALVDRVGNLLRVQREGLDRRLDESRFNIHVLEQLLPRCLKTGGDDEVRTLVHDLVHCRSPALRVPVAPAELQSQPGKQAGLGGADRTGAGKDAIVIEIGILGAMPEVGDHVDRGVVEFVRLRIDGLIGKVDFQTQQRDGLFLLFQGDVHVGGGVEPVVKIQRMGVFHHQLDGLAVQPVVRHVPQVEPVPFDQGRIVIFGATATCLCELRAKLFHLLTQLSDFIRHGRFPCYFPQMVCQLLQRTASSAIAMVKTRCLISEERPRWKKSRCEYRRGPRTRANPSRVGWA